MSDDEDLDPLDKLVARLKWDECIKKVDPTNGDDIERIARLFNQSDHLVQRFPNEQQRKKRDHFLEQLVNALRNSGREDHVAVLNQRLKEGKLFESCLHELLSFLPRTAPGTLPAERHVWALVERLAEQNKHIQADLQRGFQKTGGVFDPPSLHVEDQSGGLYRPDPALGSLAEVTASSIIMLAIQNKWRTDDGCVQLPRRVNVSEQDIFAVGITQYLGNAFAGIHHLAERWRFWGGTVNDGSVELLDATGGNPRKFRSITFVPEYGNLELVDHVASERLDRFILQNLHTLDQFHNVPAVAPAGVCPALPPSQYISRTEAFAAVLVSELYSFNIFEDTTTYGGLRFAEWIRGYAWLQHRAESAATAIDELTEVEALSELERVGMSPIAAASFLRKVLLHTSGGDLFDTPLIRVEGGCLIYHAGVIANINIPRVVLSRISSLGISIDKKGQAFEDATLRMLNDAGLNAKTFTISRDGETFQYDAVFVWDRTLFVIECKSYSIPLRKPMQLFWYQTKMEKAIRQVTRLAKAAERYSDAICAHLGEERSWSSIVPCVLNSLPWSMGRLSSGVYILDQSAVSKFFRERTLSVMVPMTIGNAKVVVRHHMKELWPESGPTAEHFLEQMKVPWQIETIRASYRVYTVNYQLSDALIFVGDFLKRAPSDIGETLQAMGIDNVPTQLAAVTNVVGEVRQGLKRVFGKARKKSPKKRRRKG